MAAVTRGVYCESEGKAARARLPIKQVNSYGVVLFTGITIIFTVLPKSRTFQKNL